MIVILSIVALAIAFFAGLTVGFSFNECAKTKHELSQYDAEQLRITMHNLQEQFDELNDQIHSVTAHVESDVTLQGSSEL